MPTNKIQSTINATLKSKKLEGRVAIVTGGGRGIGQAISQLFAAHGAKVLIATRTEKYGRETVNTILENGDIAELIEVDLGNHDAVKDTVNKAMSLWGNLDIVVHNAAYVPHSALIDTDDATFQKAMDVSVNTGFWLIKEAYPYIKKSSGGRFIFTSSLTADRNHLWGFAHYAASKGAINALVRGAAVEMGPDGITVNAVAPGGTHSTTFDAALSDEAIKNWEKTIPMRRVGNGMDIAKSMLFLASDDADYITGQIITVDGGQILGQQLDLTSSDAF